MSAATPPRSSSTVAVLSTLMTALAAGAVWSLLAIYSRSDLIVLALPVAWVIALVARSQGLGGRRLGAVVAALATLLACYYAQYLLAAASIAATIGLPLREALLRIGPEMAHAVIRTQLGAIEIAICASAVALAVVTVLWRGRLR